MDPQLKQFYRQYMQQVQSPTLPSGILLLQPDIQDCLSDKFFDSQNTNIPSQYQTSILDRVIRKIETAVKNPEDDVISDSLYETRAQLAQTSKTNVTEKKRLFYYAPVPFDGLDEPPPIIVEEAKNVIGAGNNVGLRTWEAALHLACYLWDYPEIVRGKHVIELGAGTGFLSILCAGLLRATSVLATDGISDILRSLERNIELNTHLFSDDGTRHGEVDDSNTNIVTKSLSNTNKSQPSPLPSLPTTVQLEWEDDEALTSILTPSSTLTTIPQSRNHSGSNSDSNPNHTPDPTSAPASDPTSTNFESKYDLILGADLTYHPHSCVALAKILSQLTTYNPRAKILICATERHVDTLQDFIKTCSGPPEEGGYGLHVEEVLGYDGCCGGVDKTVHEQRGFFHNVVRPIRIYRMGRIDGDS